MRNGLVSALYACVAAFLALPASADIAGFNKAVQAGDYKAATAEAAATWPTLNKSRDDIAIIANEFGYAAFRASDYAAAKTYAEFTLAQPSTASDANLSALSTLLRDLSRHRLAPSAETRTALAAAVKQRAALPGFDNITYFAADSLAAQDIVDKAWKALAEDAAMSAKMAAAGGAYYAATRRRFEHLAILGRYMETRPPAVLEDIKALQESVVADIDAAPSDDAARVFVPVYWEVNSLKFAMERDIADRTGKPLKDLVAIPPERSDRFGRLVTKNDGCVRNLAKFDPPPMLQKLTKMESALTIQVDIDDTGRTLNAELKGGLQDSALTARALKWVKTMKFEPGVPWDKTRCKLARTGHVIQLEFQMARR